MIQPESLLGGRVMLYCGDSREVLRALPDNSVDSIPCDPPYALVSIVKRFGKPGAAPAQHGADGLYARASAGFMGKQWDTGETAFDAGFWREAFRVLKPGGHVAAFSGTRTYHRLACAIEDAGFEIRDSIAHLASTDPQVRAFVESLTEAQAEAFFRLADVIGFGGLLAWAYGTGFPKSHNLKGGNEGWGTALKPAWEPIVLARKPLVRKGGGTVEANMRAHGVGALHVDACRISGPKTPAPVGEFRGSSVATTGLRGVRDGTSDHLGRWPANIVHDDSAEVVGAFPQSDGQQGDVTGAEPSSPFRSVYGDMPARAGGFAARQDSGSAARFFFSAKASSDERAGSNHPTVKPVALMQWLCRLVTPKGGLVLDPFAGTGTTGEAAWREGMRVILIEREPDYQADIRRRMALAATGPEERRRTLAARSNADTPADLGPLFAGAAE